MTLCRYLSGALICILIGARGFDAVPIAIGNTDCTDAWGEHDV